MAEYGRLRSDLDIRPEAGSGVIVKDPVTRRFYRFTAVQASVLELMDGELDPASIASRVSQKHALDVLEAQVRDFAGKLRNLLLLDEAYCWAKLEGLKTQQRRTLVGTLLSVKIWSFNPDELLTRLEAKLRFCFSPVFSFFVWSAAAAALIISILHYESLYVSMGAIFSIYSLPLIVAVIFAVMTIHEFAHGLTLKHHGGRVEEMGFMILYFIPAFYCNVSDAWMLKKRDRIRTTLAGGYIQVLIWALSTIGWRILAPETPASKICLVSIAFNAIQSLFNFNPLIRLDGYYLLSDLIEVPNLRSKALGYLKNRFTSWITGIPSAVQEPGRREKRWFLCYGAAASLFTASLVLFMLQRVGDWLVNEFHTWGIVMTSALVLMVIPADRQETVQASGKIGKALLSRLKKHPAAVTIILLLLIVGFLPWELKISGDFVVVASDRVSVTPQVAGNLKRIHVQQGTRVRAGDVLAEIENLEISNAYQEIKGELDTQRATLDLLKAGTRPEEIERARRVIETRTAELNNFFRIDQERAVLEEVIARKEAELANAQINYQRTQSLLLTGIVAKNDADRDRTAYEVRKKELQEARGQLKVLEDQAERNREVKRKELAQAQSELKILLAGSRKESIRAAESRVEALEQQLRILTRQMDLLKLRSPIEGVIATSYLHNRIGDFLDKGDIFCEIVSDGTVIVEMPVPEKEIGEIRKGFPITIKMRGYPDLWYEAHVKDIAPVAIPQGSIRTVIVHGELHNPDGQLRAGMTGVGKILCGKRTIYEIATRRAIRWLRTEFWEYLP